MTREFAQGQAPQPLAPGELQALALVGPKESVEQELNLTYHDSVESMVKVCDVVTINCPLHPKTEHLFNKEPQTVEG